MNRENWFATPIWFERTSFDFETVAKKCLELRDSNYPNRKISNVDGWQSQDIKLNEYPELQIVHDIITQKIEEVAKDIAPNMGLLLDNVWININEKGSYNTEHVHPITAFSGTIYISVDENSGQIIFNNGQYSPIKHYPFDSLNSPLFWDYVHYNPVNGLILMFPAWLPHKVMPNESDITRISISFNVKQSFYFVQRNSAQPIPLVDTTETKEDSKKRKSKKRE